MSKQKKPPQENPRKQDCFSICTASVKVWTNSDCPESPCTISIKSNHTTEPLEMYRTGLAMINQNKAKWRKLSCEPLRDAPQAFKKKKKRKRKSPKSSNKLQSPQCSQNFSFCSQLLFQRVSLTNSKVISHPVTFCSNSKTLQNVFTEFK